MSAWMVLFYDCYLWNNWLHMWAHYVTCFFFFSSCLDSLIGPRPLLWGSSIILRHTALGRTPLDERSARRRDLYLTTHNTHKTNIPAASGIRTRNLSKRAAADPRLRPRGHWDKKRRIMFVSWRERYIKITYFSTFYRCQFVNFRNTLFLIYTKATRGFCGTSTRTFGFMWSATT